MVYIKCDKGIFELKDSNHKRKIVCPLKNYKKLSIKYYNFEKEIKKKYGVNSFHNKTKWIKTNIHLAKRLWGCFWDEGWRDKKR